MRAIHFWIGINCDSTVSGAAALRAAELDSQTSAMILMREAQGRESPRFLAYFRQRLIIENLHFDDSPVCTLHRVSGVAVPILTELTRVGWEQFSCRDVILVDIHAKYVIRSFIYVQNNHVFCTKRCVKISIKVFAYKIYVFQKIIELILLALLNACHLIRRFLKLKYNSKNKKFYKIIF